MTFNRCLALGVTVSALLAAPATQASTIGFSSQSTVMTAIDSLVTVATGAGAPLPGNISYRRELAPAGTSPNVTIAADFTSPDGNINSTVDLLVRGTLSTRLTPGQTGTISIQSNSLGTTLETALGGNTVMSLNPDSFTVALPGDYGPLTPVTRATFDFPSTRVVTGPLDVAADGITGMNFGDTLSISGQNDQGRLTNRPNIPGSLNGLVDAIDGIAGATVGLNVGVGIGLTSIMDSNLTLTNAVGDLVAIHRSTGEELIWQNVDVSNLPQIDFSLPDVGFWDLAIRNIELSNLFDAVYRVKADAEFDFSFEVPGFVTNIVSIFGTEIPDFEFGLGRSADYDFRVSSVSGSLDYSAGEVFLGSVQVVPLPPSVLFLGAGAAGLVSLRRVRRAAA